MAALLPLACRDIVFKKAARMGDVRQTIAGRNGQLHDLSERRRSEPGEQGRASGAARRGIPRPSRVAMVDPDAEIVEARDSQTGASRLLARTQDSRPTRAATR